MKHTPGRWTIGGELISKQGTAIEIASVWRNTHPDRRADAPDPDTADANARLIASAPEMYLELRILEVELGGWLESVSRCRTDETIIPIIHREILDRLMSVRSTLAKATT